MGRTFQNAQPVRFQGTPDTKNRNLMINCSHEGNSWIAKKVNKQTKN